MIVVIIGWVFKVKGKEYTVYTLKDKKVEARCELTRAYFGGIGLTRNTLLKKSYTLNAVFVRKFFLFKNCPTPAFS